MVGRKKKIIFLGLLLLLVMGAFGCGKKEESYRVIKVMTLNGAAKITRQNIGELDAYVDMRLESGDAITVGKDSSMILNLDDDKYVLLESETKMTLLAEGNSEDNRTILHLTEGAVVNQLLHTLSDDSSYEVTVPNSTMAVRGTVFRVAVEYDEKGDSYAVVAVLNGVVASRLIFPDGRVQSIEEERTIPMGKMVRVHGNEDISEYYPDELQDIDFDEFSIDALEFLLFCIDNEETLCITDVRVKELIDERLENKKMAEEKTEDKTEPEKEPEEVKEQIEKIPELEAEKLLEEAAVLPSSASTSDSQVSSSSGSHKENHASSGSTSEREDDGQDKKPAVSYTVKFTFNGSVFCTQTVEEGGTASRPILQPEADGNWNFDFETVITSDTTIEWK